MEFTKSRQLQRRAHQLIPGGCHTYAKGDDQFPVNTPGFIVRGEGCHIWDVDGNEFIEYGMGCRAVTLGHGYRPVVEAAQRAMLDGANFSRPAVLEVACAETLLSMIPQAEMVKFGKEGSSVTNAAIRLARAATGRDKIAFCADHPFFSIHDWFIGSTGIDAGIPAAVKDLSVTFRYNDLESLEFLFSQHPDQIAAVILEPAKYEDPQDHFLHRVQDLCRQHGAVFILDEMITGFRWNNGGAQAEYDIAPDLSTFGKALANGFSLSALVGKRELMERGGLYHNKDRVFLLSTTHGAETHCLAAGMEVMQTYQNKPVIDRMNAQGKKLADGLNAVIAKHDLSEHVLILGRPSCLVFATRDNAGQPSQGYRTLLLQELIKHGILGQSLIISYAHTDEDIAQTVEAFDRALPIYRAALEEGYESHLVGRESQTVYRRRNEPAFQGTL